MNRKGDLYGLNLAVYIKWRQKMMDRIFDWCVNVLVYWAGIFGITYKEINVWVFVIIWPILTLCWLLSSFGSKKEFSNSQK